MQAVKCPAPPSRKSSRSTEVTTTYLRPMALMVLARFSGSSASRGTGRPWPTSQKVQRRVQTSPMIMKVAVPLPKHSPMLGQEASSQTVCSRFSRRIFFRRATSGVAQDCTRIQEGLRSGVTVGSILTGMRAIFSWALSFLPGSRAGRGFNGESDMGPLRSGAATGGQRNIIVTQALQQGRREVIRHPSDVAGAAEGAYLGHLQAHVAARVDAREGFEIHGHVEGDAVIGASAAHANADGADFARVHVDAGGIAPAAGADAIALQHVDDAVLQGIHQLPDAELQALQV